MTIVLISMFIRLKMLRVGHVLPKIPRQIPIICRHKPKTRGHVREMGEKGAKEKKGNPENKSPAEKIFFFYFYHIILLVFFIIDFCTFFIIFFIISILLVFYYRFFILFYYILLLYLFFYYRFIIELLLYFLLYRFY